MRHRYRVVAAMLVVGGVVAMSSGVAFASRPAAKASYTVMMIAPQPGFGLDWSLGQHAFWDATNASGGVDGHTINLTQCFDGTFVAQTQDQVYTCAESAVSSHVLAVVGSNSDFDSVAYPVLAANHIPDIGSFPTTPIDNTSLESVPFLIPEVVFPAGYAIQLKQVAHCKKAADVVGANSPLTKEQEDAFAAGAKWAHLKIAPAVAVPTTQSDFAPTIAILDGEGVDCIGISTPLQPSAVLGPLLTAIKDSGHPMRVTFTGVGITSTAFKAIGPAINGVIALVSGEDDALVNLVQPARVTPPERTMINEWNKYYPAATPDANLDMPGWVGADATAIVMNQAVKEHLAITGANLTKVLRSNFTINTGVEPPANFSSPGLIPGYNRIHNTYVNYIKIVNYEEQPIDFKLHNVAQSLAHFRG